MANKIAVIRTGGKQYKVSEGKVVKIEKLKDEPGAAIKFDTLLIADADGENVEIGKPSLGEQVEGKILEHAKDKKVMVVKYKNKTRYLRTKGHRQDYTKIEVTKIGA
jgi:large subunit ribosomal protein L21